MYTDLINNSNSHLYKNFSVATDFNLKINYLHAITLSKFDFILINLSLRFLEKYWYT